MFENSRLAIIDFNGTEFINEKILIDFLEKNYFPIAITDNKEVVKNVERNIFGIQDGGKRIVVILNYFKNEC